MGVCGRGVREVRARVAGAHEAVEDEGGDEAAGHSHPQQPGHEAERRHEHVHHHHHLEQVRVRKRYRRGEVPG